MSKRCALLLPWMVLGLLGCSKQDELCARVACTAGTCRLDQGAPRCFCGAAEQAQGLTCELKGGVSENDTEATATPIAPSAEERRADIAPSHVYAPGKERIDVDAYSFQVTAGRTYRFTCIPDTVLACSVEHPRPEHYAQATARPGEAVVLSLPAEANATWHVLVTSGSGSPGTYRYRLEELGPDPQGDTPETAAPLYPGGEVGVATAGENDVDVFAVPAQAGIAYQFSCSGGRNLGCLLTLMDPDGVAVSSARGTLYFEAPTAGTWYVARAAGSSSEFLSLGQYKYFLRVLGPDDHGDSGAAATPLPFPASINGLLGSPSDRDYFSFSGTPGHIFELWVGDPSGSIGAVGRVWDPAGHEVEPHAPPATGRYGVIGTGGTHLIEIAGPAGPYSFALVNHGPDDFGDTVQTAAQIGFGGARGYLIPRGDTDAFGLQLEAGRVYGIRCGGGPVLAAYCRFDFRAGAPFVASAPLQQGLDSSVRIKSAVDQPVTLLLRAQDNGVFPYLMEMSDLGMDDHGDSPGAASPLALGTDVEGVNELPGDRDTFSAALEGGRTYTVSLQMTGPRSSTLGPPPTLSLYPPGASTRVQLPHLVHTFTADAGVYTFEVEGLSQQRLGYALRVQPQ